MALPIDIVYACEQIDAVIFTGDLLQDAETLTHMESYMRRWQREISRLNEKDHPLSTVWDEVYCERARQDEKWGGPEHDDKHPTTEFFAMIDKHLARAMVANTNKEKHLLRRRLVQVAALAVAAVESIDRKAIQ